MVDQVQILACLRWLADFQILACIPLEGSVPTKDLADLAGVPENQLIRVIRFATSCGFLRETETSHVAHTPLSTQFVTNESLLDAGQFLAECAAPTALHMSSATHRFGSTRNRELSAYTLAFSANKPFDVARESHPKLNRQWSAYLRHVAGLHVDDEIADVLSQLKWSNLSNACLVEVSGFWYLEERGGNPNTDRWPQIDAQSTSLASSLVTRFPSLRAIVQINQVQLSATDMEISSSGSSSSSSSASVSDNPRITVTHRVVGMPQPVIDADVYLLHLHASPPLGVMEGSTIETQLQDHFPVLRNSRGVMLILTDCLLPEPGSHPDPEIEAVARARDLTRHQMANECDMEITQLYNLINTVKDGAGKLVVTHKLRSHSGLILSLAVKYQAY